MKPIPVITAAVLLTASLAPSLASAQAITLSTGFMPDPQRYPGMSGGPVQANTVDSSCRGFIPAQPSLILQTPTGFRFLRVFAESGQDTTLMIRGVSRTWCADDTYGQNPGVDLRGLPPGRYDIYVGSYAQGTVAQYQLALTELSSVQPAGAGGGDGDDRPTPSGGGSLGPLDASSRPVGRPINVPPGGGRPVSVNGRTNGLVNGSAVRGEGTCTGWTQPAPSHLMLLRTPQDRFTVTVMSAADTTLVIRSPDGRILCNDDSNSTRNPTITGAFPAGLYQVWVGTYQQGENRPYRITAAAQ